MSQHSNPEYIALNRQIDALRAQIVGDGQDYEETAEQMASLQYQRDELLAGILMARYNERFPRNPIAHKRALELALHANESRDSRAWGINDA